MAVAADFDRYREPARSGGGGLRPSVDRARAFRRAKRHSMIVRALRVLLPLCTVGTIGLYAVAILYRANLDEVLPALPVPQIVPEKLTMHNPHYDGYNKDGGSYSITAKTAVQPLTKPNIIELQHIIGHMTDAAKVRTDLTAARGTYDTKSGKLELYEAINVASANGMKAKLTRASVETKAGLIVSDEPVMVTMPTGAISSKSMTVRQKLKEATFVNAVVARLVPPPKAPQEEAREEWTAVASEASTDAAAPRRLVGGSDSPIDIRSNRLDISDVKKTALFTGVVRAVQDQSTLATPELLVTYEGDTMAQSGAAPSNGAGAPAGKLKALMAKGPIVLTRGTTDRVTANSLAYDAATQTALLDGAVVMTSDPDRRLSGDQAEINDLRGTLLVTGNVNALQGRNQLAGDRLFVNNKTGKSELTALGAPGHDRIKARFYQAGTIAKSKPKSKPDDDDDQIGRFQTDPSAPVDVIADRLDVDDNAKTAVFKGDVRATQGGLNLRTSELTATYTGSTSVADSAGRDAGQSGKAAELTRIEARRKVVVTSGDKQSATGDWADFDVKANKAVIGGDVILTQGPNIIRGTRLVIDMTTGETVLQTSPAAASASSPMTGGEQGEEPATGTIRRTRPSAVVFPKTLGGRPKAKPPAVDGWAATTDTREPTNN